MVRMHAELTRRSLPKAIDLIIITGVETCRIHQFDREMHDPYTNFQGQLVGS